MPLVCTENDDTVFQRIALSPKRLLKKATQPKPNPPVPVTPANETSDPISEAAQGCAEDDAFESVVEEVILVRKLGSVASLRERRIKVLRQLEIVSHLKVGH